LKTGIVAQAFGAPYTVHSNKIIAQIASQKAQEFSAPVYTQLDVLIKEGIDVEYTYEQPGVPPPTLRMARDTVKWAKRKGFRKLWIIAAKPHLWRCIRDFTYAVQETKEQIEIHSCKEIEQYSDSVWFCTNSKQVRTRSKWNWWSRELIIKLIPFSIYKRIAC